MGSSVCQIRNKPSKICPKRKILPKWRNFAKSGHTRGGCACKSRDKAKQFETNYGSFIYVRSSHERWEILCIQVDDDGKIPTGLMLQNGKSYIETLNVISCKKGILLCNQFDSRTVSLVSSRLSRLVVWNEKRIAKSCEILACLVLNERARFSLVSFQNNETRMAKICSIAVACLTLQTCAVNYCKIVVRDWVLD